MRLSSEKVRFLHSAIKHIRPNADVYLFGSRTDDEKKGGDIDILVIDKVALTLSEKLDITVAFNELFGIQKLDIVSYTPECTEPFKKVALSTAEILVP